MKHKVLHKNYSIIELYETVATEMGYTNTKEIQFDCRKINVAKNIQDGIYAYYLELIKEREPYTSESVIRADITILLAQCGPKVNENLADDEVEVFDGFIC